MDTATASMLSKGIFSSTSLTTLGTACEWYFIAVVGFTPPNFEWDCLRIDSANTFLDVGLKGSELKFTNIDYPQNSYNLFDVKSKIKSKEML